MDPRYLTKNKLRINKGLLKGRCLQVIETENLRPTGSRIRETLFNWLKSDLVGAHCLDLYSGTGILSIESLSLGASSCLAFESNLLAFNQLTRIKTELKLQHLNIVNQDCLSYLIQHPSQQKYDIVYLDPPYKMVDGVTSCLNHLVKSNYLKTSSVLFYEQPRPLILDTNANFETIKEKKAGQVYYGLVKVKLGSTFD